MPRWPPLWARAWRSRPCRRATSLQRTRVDTDGRCQRWTHTWGKQYQYTRHQGLTVLGMPNSVVRVARSETTCKARANQIRPRAKVPKLIHTLTHSLTHWSSRIHTRKRAASLADMNIFKIGTIMRTSAFGRHMSSPPTLYTWSRVSDRLHQKKHVQFLAKIQPQW